MITAAVSEATATRTAWRPLKSDSVGRICSGDPAGEDRVTLAREIEQVQPLVDVSHEDRIARHPVGEFRTVEGRIRMDRAEDARMQFRLQSCFDDVGDH